LTRELGSGGSDSESGLNSEATTHSQGSLGTPVCLAGPRTTGPGLSGPLLKGRRRSCYWQCSSPSRHQPQRAAARANGVVARAVHISFMAVSRKAANAASSADAGCSHSGRTRRGSRPTGRPRCGTPKEESPLLALSLSLLRSQAASASGAGAGAGTGTGSSESERGSAGRCSPGRAPITGRGKTARGFDPSDLL
jgi:hypothetical protein